MKKVYFKPTIKLTTLDMQPLMQNSLKSVEGLDGVTVSDSEFTGGTADSRSSIWGDEDGNDW